MQPPIQYTKTSDGVNIAYYTLGEGPALLYLPFIPFSHLQLEWQILECQRWYEQLSAGRMLVRFDGRGTGLSDRDAADFSLAAHLRDVEAVVERLPDTPYSGFQLVWVWSFAPPRPIFASFTYTRHTKNARYIRMR